MRKGMNKWICQECKSTSNFHWSQVARAARIRCTACGSARLEPCEKAKEEMATKREMAVVRMDLFPGVAR